MMSSVAIPLEQWNEVLQELSRRHRGELVEVQTHDRETNETVASRSMYLQSIRLDLEDEKNPRINVSVESEQKEIRHILFKPSHLTLRLSESGDDAALQVTSMHTSTVVRFGVGASGTVTEEAA